MSESHTYRVRGILLATKQANVVERGLDIQDVDHIAVTVDQVISAASPERACVDVAWLLTADFASWRWHQPPAVEVIGEARRGEYPVPDDARLTTCKSCGASIVWTRTAADKTIPLSVATIEHRAGRRWALSHFADCEQAKDWRRG